MDEHWSYKNFNMVVELDILSDEREACDGSCFCGSQ